MWFHLFTIHQSVAIFRTSVGVIQHKIPDLSRTRKNLFEPACQHVFDNWCDIETGEPLWPEGIRILDEIVHLHAQFPRPPTPDYDLAEGKIERDRPLVVQKCAQYAFRGLLEFKNRQLGDLDPICLAETSIRGC